MDELKNLIKKAVNKNFEKMKYKISFSIIIFCNQISK